MQTNNLQKNDKIQGNNLPKNDKIQGNKGWLKERV